MSVLFRIILPIISITIAYTFVHIWLHIGCCHTLLSAIYITGIASFMTLLIAVPILMIYMFIKKTKMADISIGVAFAIGLISFVVLYHLKNMYMNYQLSKIDVSQIVEKYSGTIKGVTS